MPDQVVVRCVASRTDLRTFLKFPWRVYKDDPNWVPPLMSWMRYKVNRRRYPTWKHMEGEYFIAWRGDQPVGTIAAFINHRHNAFQNESTGFFGLFEVYDDQEAANALLAAAAGYVTARGCNMLRGPASFSINDEFGVLTRGFDDPPVSVMSYNPPYYAHLLENAPGFRALMTLNSFNLSLRDSESSEKLDQTFRVVRRNSARRGITVRTIDSRHVSKDLQFIKDMYNSIWEDNWGFVPLSKTELDITIKSIKRYLEPRLVIFAEVHGEPAGFLMGFPDFNQPLHHAYPRPGKPELVSRAQVFWHWKLRSKINRLRIPLMGVRKEFRGIGVEAAMFLMLYEQGAALARDTGWETAEAGWVLETNQPMQRLVEAYNAEPYKQYCLFECPVEPLPGVVYAPPAYLADSEARQRARWLGVRDLLIGRRPLPRLVLRRKAAVRITLPKVTRRVSARKLQRTSARRKRLLPSRPKRLLPREISLPRVGSRKRH